MGAPSFSQFHRGKGGKAQNHAVRELVGLLGWLPHSGNQFLCGFAAEADAVGNADAVVGVAGEAQAGQRGKSRIDAGHAVFVADGILRHGATPARNLHVFGLGGGADDFGAEDLGHLAAYSGDESFVAFA